MLAACDSTGRKAPTPPAETTPAQGITVPAPPSSSAAAAPAAAPAKATAKQTEVSPVKKGKPVGTLRLTGCLRKDGNKFVLADLRHDEGLKERTLKKVEIVNPSPALELQNHIEHMVLLIGVPADGMGLHPQLLKQLAPACS
jgi:hypothetical protein